MKQRTKPAFVNVLSLLFFPNALEMVSFKLPNSYPFFCNVKFNNVLKFLFPNMSISIAVCLKNPFIVDHLSLYFQITQKKFITLNGMNKIIATKNNTIPILNLILTTNDKNVIYILVCHF